MQLVSSSYVPVKSLNDLKVTTANGHSQFLFAVTPSSLDDLLVGDS